MHLRKQRLIVHWNMSLSYVSLIFALLISTCAEDELLHSGAENGAKPQNVKFSLNDDGCDLSVETEGQPPPKPLPFLTLSDYVKQCQQEGIDLPVSLSCEKGIDPLKPVKIHMNQKTCENPPLLENLGAITGTKIQRLMQGDTVCVFVCRNYDADPSYEDINMICQNRTNKKTCFFNSKVGNNIEFRDADVDLPGEGLESDGIWVSPTSLARRGGCVSCHVGDNPWFVSDFVKSATDKNGQRLVPQGDDQPWIPVAHEYFNEISSRWPDNKIIKHEKLDPCLSCHSLGAPNDSYCQLVKMMVGIEEIRDCSETCGNLDAPSFAQMPPDRPRRGSQEEKAYIEAIKFYVRCCDHPQDLECQQSVKPAFAQKQQSNALPLTPQTSKTEAPEEPVDFSIEDTPTVDAEATQTPLPASSNKTSTFIDPTY